MKESSCDKNSFLLKEKLRDLRDLSTRLSPWERVQICRHPDRPRTSDYIREVFHSFQPLRGDRCFSDDPALIGGLAYIDDFPCMLIGQETGKDTLSRIEHHFGMMHPEGFRKALRLGKLAEKFSLPLCCLVDTQGAYPGLEAEQRGQGWAIAQNLLAFSMLKIPIIVLIIGEGCSGGALGIALGDQIAMLEHAYYSVISPEGCASILWKDASKSPEAAKALSFNSENLLALSLVDEVIQEGAGGAHKHPADVYKKVKSFFLREIERLQKEPVPDLLEKRYQKFRSMGVWVEEVNAPSS